MQPRKAQGMASQVHSKPLEAFQPGAAFKPAHFSAALEINNYSIWKTGWGAMLMAGGEQDPQEKSG